MSQAARSFKNSLVSALLYTGFTFLVMALIYYASSPMGAYEQQAWGTTTAIALVVVFFGTLFK